jgi:hypothetical protein
MESIEGGWVEKLAKLPIVLVRRGFQAVIGG